MSNAWNQAEDLSKKHAEQGGLFVRLPNNGDKVVGAFCGDPHAREVHWTGEGYDECTGEGCALCKSTGKKPSLRVALNFYMPAEHGMKIYEAGTRVFQDILKLRGKYGLSTWTFEIERHGEAGSPKTKYSVLPEAKIDPELQAEIDAAELHDLARFTGGVADDEFDSYDRAVAAEKPVHEATVTALTDRLRGLPGQSVSTFLKHFGIQKVRDLPATDEQAALALVTELEQQHGAPQDAVTKQVDPFS